MALRNPDLHAKNDDDDICRPVRLIVGAVKVMEWLPIGPSVEECLKFGFGNWCRDVQIIGDCIRE